MPLDEEEVVVTADRCVELNEEELAVVFAEAPEEYDIGRAYV